MFSTKNIESYYQEFIALSETEKSKLESHLRYIDHYNKSLEQELEEDLKTLEACTEAELYKFSANSPVFETFYEREDIGLTEIWIPLLKEKGYPGEPVTSIDQKRVVTTFDQLRGAYLFDDYVTKLREKDRAKALFSLDLSCEMGIFQALSERCTLNQEKIKKSSDEKEKAIAYGQLFADTKLLGNLYGTVGHLHASTFFSALGSFFSNESNEEGNEAFAALAYALQKSAAEHFFMGQDLEHHHLTDDEKLIKSISGEEGLGIFGFTSWEAAADKLLEPFDLNTQIKIRSEAIKKMEHILEQRRENQI